MSLYFIRFDSHMRDSRLLMPLDERTQCFHVEPKGHQNCISL